MQTEKAKSSHFDRTRGDKNQIFRTYISKSFFYLITVKYSNMTDPNMWYIGKKSDSNVFICQTTVSINVWH